MNPENSTTTAKRGGGGEHGEPTHGLFLYRETMRVPLVIHGPEFGIRPAVIDQATSLADVAPTVLEVVVVGMTRVPLR